mmetsp:Transcript_23629/g.65539  ORF Transcript_23629/g.65539 Transcript_23629/m.65539 type:complete len:298 (-) Transcript_23629:69-962(-)
METLLFAQAVSLLWIILWCTLRVVADLPFALFRIVFGRRSASECQRVEFYEGQVIHSRRKPLQNSFKYKVRLALLDLDNPPSWFQSQGADHLSAQEAREFANSSGPVKLLTNPKAAGYIQNPISVYYCYLEGSRLDKCIAEVTNTPWGDRVRFIFNPRGEDVPKSLHVSPFMDMRATWHLVAPAPLDHLSLTVLAQRHPKFGDFFDAHLVARRVSGPTSGLRNEEASLMTLLRYGYMPQRTACLIYWQAVKLLWKGATFYTPPMKVPASLQGQRISCGQIYGNPAPHELGSNAPASH